MKNERDTIFALKDKKTIKENMVVVNNNDIIAGSTFLWKDLSRTARDHLKSYFGLIWNGIDYSCVVIGIKWLAKNRGYIIDFNTKLKTSINHDDILNEVLKEKLAEETAHHI